VQGSSRDVGTLMTMAQSLFPAARVYVVRLVLPGARATFLLDQQNAEGPLEEDSELARAFEKARAEGCDVRKLSFVSTRPALDICDLAEVKATSAIVLGSSDPALVRDVLESAACPVAVFVEGSTPFTEAHEVAVVEGVSADDAAARRFGERIASRSGAVLA